MISGTALSTFFRVTAVPSSDLDRLRRQGADDFGHRFVVRTMQDDGGTPLRCCLRDARPGERFMLIAWRPAEIGGPYAEVGPIFVHADRCAGYSDNDSYPAGFRNRRQLFRAYDTNGCQVDNRIVDGADAESVVAELFGRADVSYIHSRNVLAGCYMFAISRSAGGPT